MVLAFGATGAASGSRVAMRHAADVDMGVTLTGGAEPGSVTITNRGQDVQWVARAMAVEWRDGVTWTHVVTTMDLVAECDLRFPRRTGAVRLRPGQFFAVVPWRGYNCSGQCPSGCHLSYYVGPGPYRMVATLLPGGARVVGPTFLMPERPAPPVDHAYTMADMLAAYKRPRRGEHDP